MSLHNQRDGRRWMQIPARTRNRDQIGMALGAVLPANPPSQPVIIKAPPIMLMASRSIAADLPIRLRLPMKMKAAAMLIAAKGKRCDGLVGREADAAAVWTVMTVGDQTLRE